MSNKRVTIGTKPSNKPAQAAADAWVERRDEREAIKRMTIDIPESLHRAIKAQCALRGTKMVEEVRQLLEQKYGREEA